MEHVTHLILSLSSMNFAERYVCEPQLRGGEVYKTLKITFSLKKSFFKAPSKLEYHFRVNRNDDPLVKRSSASIALDAQFRIRLTCL